MISHENIYLNVEVNDYKDALKTLGELLYKKNYVKDTYTNALLKREEISPTGLPIHPWSIAIPHTDPEHVIKPCIIILKLKNDIEFREMASNDKTVNVKYIFGLVFTDGKKQIPLLSSIINMTKNQEAMENLLNANDEDEIYKITTKYINNI
ncbi:PTS sugar transporter subunit IIA [Anaerofustis butyriciformans]|uniref:PTS sugar transporter subunit IIA n=1 Tax=Anaerofustis butyriciformans TaxID=3108533 RepID=UPI002E381130|nr:PTS sugar transporter subunit IIA [Anaerofustis sp. HA2171]